MPHIPTEPTFRMEYIPPDPLSPEAELQFYNGPDEGAVIEDGPSSTWAAAFGAQFKLQNVAVSDLDTFPKQFDEVEGYDPFTDPQTQGYDPILFAESMSPDESAYNKDQFDRNMELINISSSGPTSANVLGGLFGAVTSPPVLASMFVPGGFAAVGIAGMVGEATNEIIAHAQQPARHGLESAMNIGLAGVGFGILGAISGRTITKTFSVNIDDLPEEFIQKVGIGAQVVKLAPKAQVKDINVVHPWLVKALGGTKSSPATDVLTNSPSALTKQTVADMVEVSVRVKGGKATFSIESANKAAEGDIATMQQAFADHYDSYRNRGQGGMSVSEFNEAISDAMRSGGRHAIPEVEGMAKVYRKFDSKYFDDLAALKQYGDKIKNPNHLQRIYNRKKILANRDGLRRLLLTEMGKTESMIIQLNDELFVIRPEHWMSIQEQHGNNVQIAIGKELDEAVNNTINSMMGRQGMVDYADSNWVVSKAGSLHERTLDFLTDAQLKPWLENNASAIMAVTAQQMTRSTNMIRKFGDLNMEARFLEIEKEYDELMNAATSEKQRIKIDKRRVRDRRVLLAFRDMLMGTYGRPDTTSSLVNFSRNLRTYTLLSMGLNIPSSSISDLLAPALRHGLKPYYSGIKFLLSGAKNRKAYKEYVQRLGLAIESHTNSRAAAFVDAGFMNQFQRDAQKIWSKYTLMNTFTDISQFMNASSTSEMWLGWMAKPLSEGNAQKLLDMGITRNMAKRISAEAQKFRRTAEGISVPESHLWDDRAAAEAFENGLRKEVHTTTIVPGIGDVPLWMKETEAGRFFGMFKTFIASAHTKFLIAGLQRHDADFLAGVLVMLTGSVMTVALKEGVKGKSITDLEMDELMVKAVDRSGILGWITPGRNTARAIIAGELPNKYDISRGATDAITPAPAAALGNAALSGYGALQGNDADTWKFIRSLPMANTLHAVDLLQTVTDNQP